MDPLLGIVPATTPEQRCKAYRTSVYSSRRCGSITGRGLSLLVPANSVLVMADKDVQLDCGSALINTSNGTGARLSNMRFAPRDSSARFEIRQEQSGFRVVAYDGVLNVTNGSAPTLAPGQTMFAAAGCAADPTPSGQKSGAPIPAAGTNVGAAVLLGVAVAAALAALVYVTTRSKCTALMAPARAADNSRRPYL
jgi:hypothetical protein